jgi:hypothetical protein
LVVLDLLEVAALDQVDLVVVTAEEELKYLMLTVLVVEGVLLVLQ